MILGTTFLQNIALLGITALLTGLVVPYVLRVIDDRKTSQQKEREGDLARQAKLIDTQAKFLDDIAGLLWRWRYMSMKVAYYGSRGADDRYEAAWREYDENIWQVLSEVRNEVSRSRRLVSEPVYRTLRSMYEEDMVTLDQRLSSAREGGSLDPHQTFHELNQSVYHEVTDRIDETLAQVAAELGLSGASPER